MDSGPRELSPYNAQVCRIARRDESTETSDAVESELPVKKRKLSHSGNEENVLEELEGRLSRESLAPLQARSFAPREEIPDSEAESESEDVDSDTISSHVQRTDLEQALPSIKTDKEAIEEYEAFQSSRSDASSDLGQRLESRAWLKGKRSIYVDAFDLALETVLEEESHLFNDAEMGVFEAWRDLSYEAKYLYVRLFLRKTAAWHRINRLGYYGDIGDMAAAIGELFERRRIPENSEKDEIFSAECEATDAASLQESFTFADDSEAHVTSVDEASSLLMLDELKVLAKEVKVNGKNKSELLRALRSSVETQTSLKFVGLARSESKEINLSELAQDQPLPQSRPDTSSTSRDSHLLPKIMSITGKCVRLSEASRKLFERVHLVFYRSTEWTEKSLTTIILARISRRNFPEYIVSRSSNIFESRSLLLEFEVALRAQFRVDNILEFQGTPTLESLQTILDIFENVYPRWVALLTEEQRKEDSIYISGEGAYLRRLSPAWVYTRIIHKAAGVLGLGKFKDHAREHAVLTKLLSQRLFHASRRGAWYQRKALVEEHYMGALSESAGRSSEEQKKHWKRIALQTCEQGLEDNLVHVIHHYDLQKRVIKLEKTLKVPKRLQHDFGHARLAKPIERAFEGVRIDRSSQASKPNGAIPLFRRDSSAASGADVASQKPRRSTKTIWHDPSPESLPHSEVSVEAMCLSHYRSMGWKGFHSEGGILRTLFALLFHDVLFTYIPDVFQTPYQTCPLDLHTDAFFPSRMSEINARLAEIANGLGEMILVKVWEMEYERKTCVIGLDWTFELSDLRSIVRAFGGEKLATVCKTMAQEYAQRAGGVPDLFLWKDADDTQVGEVLFAEVKSENDRLSDTQRLWIHVLTSAGVRVELCNAVAKEVKYL